MPHSFVKHSPVSANRSPSAGHSNVKDTRSDLGYGRIEPKFHVDLVQSSHFPYIADDLELPEEEVLDDEVLDDFLNKVGMKPKTIDPGSRSSADPFYFVGGNTSLADCFDRPDDILCEIEVVAKAMSVNRPFLRKRPHKPKQQRGPNDQVGASFPSGGPGNFRPTGSKKGFSSPPPEIIMGDESIDPVDSAYRLEDILSPDEKAVSNSIKDRNMISRKNKEQK